MPQCSLVSTDDLIGDDKCYTYHQATASHILGCLQSVTILDDGSNLSDHLPVTMVCDLSSRAAFLGRQDDPVSVSGKACHFNVPESTNNYYQLRWDKSDLISYYSRSYELLACIDARCLENGHVGNEHCYTSIVHSLQVAAVDTIPHKKKNFYKF